MAVDRISTSMLEVLQIRLRAARASTRKLVRMLQMADPTTRRCTASSSSAGPGRTGRWSGRGVQVQNLPRVPKGFDPELFTRWPAKPRRRALVR